MRVGMRWATLRVLLLGLIAGLSGEARAQERKPNPLELPPEISRSVGVPGGVVVLWPRVIPDTDDPDLRAHAALVQGLMQGAAQRALPDAPLDVRPEPERVCQRNGCNAVSVGATLLHKDQGCAVVATVAPPGRSTTRLVLAAGVADLSANALPFREPPESYVTVVDFERCTDLNTALSLRMAAIEAAIRDAAGIGATGQPPPTRVIIPGGSGG